MKIFENTLSQDTLGQYYKEIKHLIHNRGKWLISDLSWQDELKKFIPGTCLMAPTSEKLKLQVLNDIKQHLPFSDSEKVAIAHQVWLKNSGINWHMDPNYNYGATIYLNKNWNANYGGIFIWKDKDQKRIGKMNAYCPVHNSMVINDEHEDHLVTIVSPFAPENRFTLQIWGLSPQALKQKDK